MARTFTPLGERILVKPAEREEQTKSGIFLPDTAQEKPQEGTIIEAVSYTHLRAHETLR